MLTKTQIEVMKVFTSKIDCRFSINEIAKKLGKPYPLIHRAMQELIKEKFVVVSDKKLLSLNYRSNFAELAFFEALRTSARLSKEKSVSLFVKDCLNGLNEDFFIMVVFGSFVESGKFRDLDLLVGVDSGKELTRIEKTIKNISLNFSFSVDLHVISRESAYEMLSKREQINILNETLNKHLIIFGGENYYRILNNARR